MACEYTQMQEYLQFIFKRNHSLSHTQNDAIRNVKIMQKRTNLMCSERNENLTCLNSSKQYNSLSSACIFSVPDKLVILCLALAVCNVASLKWRPPGEGEGEGEGEGDGEGEGEGGWGCPTCPEFGIFQAPDRTSCSRFIQCNNGQEALHNCSHGMHFSTDRGICVDRESANCDICRFNDQPIRFWPFEGSCTRSVSKNA